MRKKYCSAIAVFLCLVMIMNVAMNSQLDTKYENSVEVASINDYIPEEILPEISNNTTTKEIIEVKEEDIDFNQTIISSAKNRTDSNENDKSLLDEMIDSALSGTDTEDINSIETDSNVTVKSPADDSKDKGEVPFDISNPDEFENGDIEYTSNTILVKLPKSYGQTLTRELYDAGIGKIDVMFSTEDCTWFTAYLLKDKDVNETMGKVRELDSVVVAEYNFVYETTSATIDEIYVSNPRAKDQWVLKSCGVEGAWEALESKGIEAGGSRNVTVAVIDTGVDYTHKDLASNIWINKGEIPDNGIDDDNNGYIDDYYGVDITAKDVDGGSAMDDEGHGTHVAGIIAAANNNEGVVGLAYNTQIMAIKSGNSAGIFTQGNIAAGIIYAFNNGADVINMSFGGVASSIAVQDALSAAYARCVLVASAGNGKEHNQLLPNYPAAFPQVLGVMSVNSKMVESDFTNWDLIENNELEYEIYAPGEKILSTLPGDIYGALSGTSMAAPIVAAQAALLRSYYTDRSTYPTKYIYGQIVGTADDVVSCINERGHGNHNIPGCINFENSFGELPVPDLGITDVTIFDSKNYPADTQNLTSGKTSQNNGDGVIDAGEVLSVGFTIKNRWGKSMNSVVHLEAVSATSGVESPYVEILNNDIDYGSVGTYSETDCGKIMDGDRWTGWEKPFYVKIADNCPNDYTIRFEITVTYKNGIVTDDKDYISGPYIMNVPVRRGVILPNVIKEDMVLTSDNYYILKNALTIWRGAKLTVEEGTQIQFWTNDELDPLAETSIVYLKVEGELICNGTKEKPIKIFPSELFSDYRVEIDSDNGYAKLDYVDVTNPYLKVDKLTNCTFRQNSYGVYYYRRLINSVINERSETGRVEADLVEKCRFYKLGSSGCWQFDCYGEVYRQCIFYDSAVCHGASSYEDCVFYGNSIYEMGEYQGGSSYYVARPGTNNIDVYSTFCIPENEKAYVAIKKDNSIVRRFMQFIGMDYAVIKSNDELKAITNRLNQFKCGLTRLDGTSKFFGADGEPVPSDIPIAEFETSYDNYCYKYGYLDGIITPIFGGDYYEYTLYEKSITNYVTNIELDKYAITLDTECTYRINPKITPSYMDVKTLFYKSEDDSIATVNSDGLIQAKEIGSTRIRVYSPDLAIYNYITVNVVNKIEANSIELKVEKSDMEAGTCQQAKVIVLPENCTKKNGVYFSSSNEDIVKVDYRGMITAVSPGKACISVGLTEQAELTDQIEIEVVVTATAINFDNSVYCTSLTKENDADFYPTISPADASVKEIEWSSTDTSVCYVNDDGKLVKNKTGISTISATIKGTNIKDSVDVVVVEKETEEKNVTKVKVARGMTFAIYNGDLYIWGENSRVPKKAIFPDTIEIKDFFITDYDKGYYLDLAVLEVNGTLRKYRTNNINTFNYQAGWSVLTNIEAISDGDPDQFYAISKKGTVYGVGDNTYGQLGNGAKGKCSDFEIMDANFNAKKVISSDNGAFILDDQNNLYMTGGYYLKLISPTKIASDVKDIYMYSQNEDNEHFGIGSYTPIALFDSGYSYLPMYSSSLDDISLYIRETDNICYVYYDEYKNGTSISSGPGTIYIKNGIVYGTGGNMYGQIGEKVDDSELYRIEGIDNAKSAYCIYGTTYIITEDGDLYALGCGKNYRFGNGKSENSIIPIKVLFDLSEVEDELNFVQWNGIQNEEKNILEEYSMELNFSRHIEAFSQYSSISIREISDGKSEKIPIHKRIDINRLIIEPREGWEIGKEYKLLIPQGALGTKIGATNEEYTITFSYFGPETKPTEDVSINDDSENNITDDSEQQDIIVDEEEYAKRNNPYSIEDTLKLWDEYVGKAYNTSFRSNVILNRINNSNIAQWMRIEVSNGYTSNYVAVPIGGNYWGTDTAELIEKCFLNNSYGELDMGEILTEAPVDTFPFVVDAYLLLEDEKTNIVGKDLVTFVVEFNRDMQTDIPLKVGFGSSYPYNSYIVEGAYDDNNHKLWKGTIQLDSLIENGYYCWSVSNGCAEGTDMELYEDWGRFPFKIDNSNAQSLDMQGSAKEDGIHLSWEQDDFTTLAGYNLYRATKEDGIYTKVNRTLIPSETKSWVDDEVEPGQKYYYNFTVVDTDMKESEPSGKIAISALDTMAPSIYHSPIVNAYADTSLIINATITDNVAINGAKLYYRTVGEEEWKSIDMNCIEDKYSAVILASEVTIAGVEYYIAAYDGVSYSYRGNEEEPFLVIVQQMFEDNSLGDVDGNGVINIKDAMMILMAINDRLNLSFEEFSRADLDGDGELTAREALRIIMYSNGSISSIKY